ncbi:MAG: hypothetical protein JO305_04640 [Alphaproteobacteria bacterium]|nr:hypothetical protein [Alphaproteobacteria bacterium]
MTTMIAELYDALLAAGSPEDKARKAAEAMAGYEAYEGRFVRLEAALGEVQRDVAELKRDVGELKQRVSRVERDLFVVKWMLGFVLAFQVAIFLKMFLH